MVPIEPVGQQSRARVAFLFGSIYGLSKDIGVRSLVGKDCRSQLPAGVTVDTSTVDKEIAGYIIRVCFFDVSHARSSYRRLLPTGADLIIADIAYLTQGRRDILGDLATTVLIGLRAMTFISGPCQPLR